MAEFRFWSDTNQRLFESDLAEFGITFERRERFVVSVEEALGWVIDLASDLGADLHLSVTEG